MQSIDNFEFQRLLGFGGFGHASLYKTSEGKRVVIKTIKKQVKTRHFTVREIHAGKALRHKNIAKFYSDFQDDETDYLVFELAKGVDVFKYLQDTDFVPFSERIAKQMFRQLATAINYCHQKGVVHLDIKLDNIMFDPKTKKVKLIDFGLCNFINKTNGGLFTGRVGSEEYWPAEIVPENFGPYNGTKIDVWCLGIVLYCLLHAGFPYDYKKRICAIREWNLHPSIKIHSSISAPGQDLIRKMLEVDPEKRIGMDQVLKHPWIKKSFAEKFSL